MGKLVRFSRKKQSRDEAARPLFPPFGSGATDARPGGFASDAASSGDLPRPGASPDPENERKKRMRRQGAIAALAIVFVCGTAAALFGDRGYLDVRRQRRQYLEMREALAAHLQRVEALRHEVDRLKTDPSRVERIAREDLGYVAKDEITLLLPGDDTEPEHGLDAKRGSAIVPAVPRTP